ncbi:hypothetical protein mRhiFer1_008417 [Rhinolophus ferrumequinum]|uniref:Uncharacterized protein n=1 Tax=Rhinolophus ferrumequinum TaxID=59479 RepID=A0A7J7V8B4_RHIFE|nr:hypothetical protein mRhiFer1_008417 [Rhinolophus ferrumequinum]
MSNMKNASPVTYPSGRHWPQGSDELYSVLWVGSFLESNPLVSFTSELQGRRTEKFNQQLVHDLIESNFRNEGGMGRTQLKRNARRSENIEELPYYFHSGRTILHSRQQCMGYQFLHLLANTCYLIFVLFVDSSYPNRSKRDLQTQRLWT